MILLQSSCHILRYTLDFFFSHISLSQEDDFVQLAAKHLYVQHGSDSSPENVKEAVQECINSSLLEAKSEAKWAQMVSTAHAEVSDATHQKVQHELNRTGKKKMLYNENYKVDFMFPSIFLKPQQGPYLSSKQKADSVKAEMVDYAREKWPMFFSRFFEVVKLSGKRLLAEGLQCRCCCGSK